ncbi:MAG: hypothetical protein HY678_11245, partial [Chloroflexi bacterium]|nr:hypothetical protein [Chloroflexota bacterium]
MKITNIDIIPIYPRIAQRNQDKPVEYRAFNHLTVFRVATDNGLVGYGDCRTTHTGSPDRSTIEPLLGRDPFDFINNNFVIGLGGALYDVMGKHLGIPAYKLMGQKLRDAVSVA